MSEITILDLPEVALEKILFYLTYDEIACSRTVCKQFNNICGGLLTKGFIQLEKKHAHIYKIVKALLPRRPSERRSNMLVSRYCEILQGMETRIRMLNVTYMRYIDQHLICFVPGKVLDEIRRLLGLIESRFDPPSNNNQLLEELRDLSSMAMEHFDEHILPRMEKREEAIHYKHIIPSTSKPPEDNRTLKELKKLHKRNRIFKSQLTYLVAKTRRLAEKFNRQNIRVKKQSSIIKDQNAKIQNQATRLENHEMTISEMKKKFEEMQTNFMEMKSKWELDMVQSTSYVSSSVNVAIKDATQESDLINVSKNLRKAKQNENLRQRYNIMRRLNNRNIMESKPQTSKDNSRRRCLVDAEIIRHKGPTSRVSYSLFHRNHLRNKPNKSEFLSIKNQNEQHSNVTEGKTSKENADFVYKSIIKQRPSRVFPLTCLDIERKRKSDASSEVPSKLSKNLPSNTLKALNLIQKYLPGPHDSTSKSKGVPSGSAHSSHNILTYLDSNPLKRKRESSDDI